MSVFFSTEPPTTDARLAELWRLLRNEQFVEAMDLSEPICQDINAPVEFFCGLSLAYGECGYYHDAERVARMVVGFGERQWRARHALAVALMHQGRFGAALDSLGFYRDPVELFVIRAQIEMMGNYIDSLRVTLEDALNQDCPPDIQLLLAYLYSSTANAVPDWGDLAAGVAEVIRLGAYLDVWERDAGRHYDTPYGLKMGEYIREMHQLLGEGG